MSQTLEFQEVSKSYGNVQAVKKATFSVKGGEFFSILGPSGCGKTSLLRLVAGFEQPDHGAILLDGQDITKIAPNKRPVNTVFQSYALFPHLTVFENIAFGLRLQKKSEQEVRNEVERMLHLIQMEEQVEKLPDMISGGQKQRVAIARALIMRPRILLLDEPLAALDLKLRQRMLIELDRIHDEVGITFIFVTHDQTEAMAVSDRIAVMNGGLVEQVGSPIEVYEAPKSSFVAAFIGDTNFLDGIVSKPITPEYSELMIEDFPSVICFNDKQLSRGELVHLTVRPEKIRISRESPKPTPQHNLIPGKVDDVIYKGDHTKFWVKVGDYRISVLQPHSRFLLDEKPITWNDNVWLSWHADDGFLLERYSEKDEALTEMTLEENE